MVRYTGPKNLIIKSLGNLPGFKVIREQYVKLPIKESQLTKRIKKSSDYGLRLKEKQKIKYNYGISEPQLYRYVKKIQYLPIRTQYDLLNLIELRLDTIVYNLGFTSTIASARQLINHGKIFVNAKRVTIANFICTNKDIIFVKFTKKQKELFVSSFIGIPNHLIKLTEDCGQLISDKITSFKLKIEEQLVIEFYSKR